MLNTQNQHIIGVPPRNQHIIGVPPRGTQPALTGEDRTHLSEEAQAHQATAGEKKNPFKFDPAHNPAQLLSPLTSFAMDRLWENRDSLPKWDPTHNPSQLFVCPLAQWGLDKLRTALDNAH